MAAKKPVKRNTTKSSAKPKGWGDWGNPVDSFLRKTEKNTKGITSAQNLRNTKKAGELTKKLAIEMAIGDPKKGPVSMAVNAASWAIPYGKGAKAIDMAIKGTRFAKTAKVARGIAKTAGVIATDKAVSKVANINTKKTKRKPPARRVPKAR